MRLISDDEAAAWCADRRLRTDGKLVSDRISFVERDSPRFRVEVRGSPTQIVGLAYVIAMTGVSGDDEDAFEGGLLWLQRWEIWSETVDRVGYAFMTTIERASDGASTLSLAPGRVFLQTELVNAHASLSLPMMFQWDAHYVPTGGEFFVQTSHHGYVDFVSRNTSTHEQLVARFERGGWTPNVVPSPPASSAGD